MIHRDSGGRRRGTAGAAAPQGGWTGRRRRRCRAARRAGRGADGLKGRASRAIYVGYGAYDAETKPGALALAGVFESAHWPVRLAEHPSGHGAREVYLDEAFAFRAAHAAP